MQKLIPIFLLLCASTLCKAQQPARFLHYSVKDGLSQNSVHAIFRDHDGLVWIGTQDGLNSFDGKTFTVYRHDDNDSTSISDQFVVSIKEDAKGYLWIGTRNGLNRFNKHTGKFRRYYLSEEEKHVFQASYFDFFLQNDGRVIVPKSEYAIIIEPESGRQTKIYAADAEISDWFIYPDYRTVTVNAKNKMYYSPDLRRAKFTDAGRMPGKENPALFPPNITAAGDSILLFYIREKSGEINCYNVFEKKWQAPVKFTTPLIHVNAASANEIYIASLNGICKTFRSGGTAMIQSDPGNNNSLPPGNILCTYTDNEGNLWAGTSGNGFAVNNRSFENYILVKPPVANDVISCIAKTPEAVYAGSRSGLFKLSNFSDEALQKGFQPFLPGKIITSITIDQHQNIWTGIQGEGIYVLNKTGTVIKKFSPANTPMVNTSVMHLCTDSRGRIMVCSTLGFYIAPSLNEPWIAFSDTSVAKRIAGNYVMHAYEDKQKNIWISTNQGLTKYNASLTAAEHFISSDDKSSFIKRTIITGVTEDLDGALWISTIRNGIYKYSDGKYVHYTAAEGLSSDVVYNLVCDNNNRIWATTSAGLNVFDKEQNSFTLLSVADGLPAGGFVFGAAKKDEAGNILLGTSEGLLICNANNIKLHKTNITAFIEDIKVNGQSISQDNNSFEIIPDNKVINFTFGSSPAFSTGNIIYQYRLQGQSNDWITLPQGVHTISYTGLPYKKLVMEVRAATSAGNLGSSHISSFTIVSKAPFWKTPVFIIAAGIMLLALLVLIIMEYNKRNYRKQLEVLRVEKGLQNERVRIGRDLHDNIGAYTSALIAGLNHIRPNDEAQVKQIDDLKDYGVNIMSFLRETIWMLNSETLTVTAFADRFKNYALRIGKNYPATDLSIHENIVNNKTLPPTLMLNLFRILQEALQNAYKHAAATQISISIESNAVLTFVVADNGKGFGEKENKESYGLENMRQRSADSGFDFRIESTAAGTAVRLTENTANAALQTNNETGNL